MARYIDADALIEEIWKKHKETEELFDLCVDELKEVYCGVVALIDEQPTAYNVDAVVAELEELKKRYHKYFYCDYNEGAEVGIEEALAIVRKGGVHE